MRALVVVAAVAALPGCTSPEHTVRSADYRLTNATLTAALAWNEALLRGPCPEVQLIPVGYHATADIVVTTGRDPKGRRAYTDVSSLTILLDLERIGDAGSSEDDYPAIIAHELGHALGIEQGEHSPDPDDLMHHTFPPGRSPEPTGFDVAWVCDHW